MLGLERCDCCKQRTDHYNLYFGICNKCIKKIARLENTDFDTAFGIIGRYRDLINKKD